MKIAAEVLVVDDNPGDKDLVAELLAQSGGRSVHIHSVGDGLEAMAFLRRQGKYSKSPLPHLILLDLNMPRKDGWAVLGELKSDVLFKQIPVVIFTTSRSSTDIKRCHELGANSYVSKPVNLEGYTSTISTLANYWFGIASLPQGEA